MAGQIESNGVLVKDASRRVDCLPGEPGRRLPRPLQGPRQARDQHQ